MGEGRVEGMCGRLLCAFTDRLFDTDHKQTLTYPEVGWGSGVSGGGADVYCMPSQSDYLITDHKL